ncbi:MAG: tyrosine recombinase [Pseudomonadota bacterium]
MAIVEQFLEMMSVERGASAHTLAAYRNDLDQFARFCAAEGLAMEAAGETDVRAFVAAMARAGAARTTQNRRLSAVRRYFAFLCVEGVRQDDPGAQVRGAKAHRALPNVLEADAVDRLFVHADAEARAGAANAVRMLTLIELIYACGLRVSEAIALGDRAVDAGDAPLRVLGKGGRERMLPLTSRARAAVTRWRAVRGPSQRYLFPAASRSGHLTRQAFARDLKSLAVGAGLSATLSPHGLRHAFATHLVQRGADLRVVQALLGHQDISTTEIYTHVGNTHLAAVVSDCHPLSTAP